MKYILISLMLLFSIDLTTFADGILSDGECVDALTMPYKIVQRLDDHHYEISGEFLGAYRMILVTKKAIYSMPGHLTGIKITPGKIFPVALKNGFTDHVNSYVECGLIPYPALYAFNQRALAYRRLIKGIDGDAK